MFEPMAFKRSAVWFRLSTQKVVKSDRLHDFFFIFRNESSCGHMQDAFKNDLLDRLYIIWKSSIQEVEFHGPYYDEKLPKATFAEVFAGYISAVTDRGVKDKTIATYIQHFYAISTRLEVSMPINRLSATVWFFRCKRKVCPTVPPTVAHAHWNASSRGVMKRTT